MERAMNLGKSETRSVSTPKRMPKTPTYRKVNLTTFKNFMSNHPPPDPEANNIVNALDTSFQIILKGANESKVNGPDIEINTWEQSNHRWKNLMESKDPKTIWGAINWKGDIDKRSTNCPDDEHFKIHFEELLNDSSNDSFEQDLEECPYIPILDDPFVPTELDVVMKDLKPGKSFTGICPGLFAVLPTVWLTFFVILFNILFLGMNYPVQWTYSKLVTLFKSGNRMVCGNYRGISIMDTLAKIYDKLLLNRLLLWSSIDKCQAGAQKGRGCIEQIMTLRLLIDLAKSKKKKLYVLFIDFAKAYDKVPRNKLIKLLKSLGCGKIMLYALKNMYKNTYNVLNSIIISSSIGVRQGSPTSCMLFTMYVDKVVKMVKEAIPTDGFLGELHMLLLMDDTVIMASSREACMIKMKAVLKYCEEYGMELNTKKTKFFVINANNEDKISMKIDEKEISYCTEYFYLGSWFTDDGKMESALNLHVRNYQFTCNKFALFCSSNTEMPYYYKSLVMDAAAVSSIFYGCETFFSSNPKQMINAYNQLVRGLLGVRSNTSMHICLIESGKDPPSFIMYKKLKTFIENKMKNRDLEEPFQIVYEMCKNQNSPGFKFIQKAINKNENEISLDSVIHKVRQEAGSKFKTYREVLNPNLEKHEIYNNAVYIPDYLRLQFTRLRLMSHNLKVETGRWSRTPEPNRVCRCDRESVQNEKHVLLQCPLSAHLRQENAPLQFNSVEALMNCNDMMKLCKYVNMVMQIYQ